MPPRKRGAAEACRDSLRGCFKGDREEAFYISDAMLIPISIAI